MERSWASTAYANYLLSGRQAATVCFAGGGAGDRLEPVFAAEKRLGCDLAGNEVTLRGQPQYKKFWWRSVL